MKYELLIGRRYLRASRGNRFISFISTISMAGIAIGVAVLIVVLSVMNGFEREVRVRILSLTSHASISALSLRLGDWQDAAARVRDNPSVLAAAPYIEEQALLLASGSKSSGAIVTGVLPQDERQVTVIADKVTSGSFAALASGEYGIVLGDELAKALGVGMGDRVVIVTPLRTVDAGGRDAAHAWLQSRRPVFRRHVRVRPQPCLHSHRRRRTAVSDGRRRDGVAAEAGRPVRGAVRGA